MAANQVGTVREKVLKETVESLENSPQKQRRILPQELPNASFKLDDSLKVRVSFGLDDKGADVRLVKRALDRQSLRQRQTGISGLGLGYQIQR